jgi:hypothetical protein
MKLAVMACVVLLTACAADTMQSYVGQDIRNVVIRSQTPSGSDRRSSDK